MNYLISAYSVNPYHGSEDGVGWNWVLQYEKNYTLGDRIILLTKECNRLDTLNGLKEFGIKHIELATCDVPLYLNWYREKHSFFHHMYYILWQHWAWLWVKKSKIKFDVIHHVTMGDYRILSEMHKANDSITIYGPIGGAQITPKSLMPYEQSFLIANFRATVNKFCGLNPLYARYLNCFTSVFPSNKETYNEICKIRKKKYTKQVVEIGIANEYKNLDISRKNKRVPTILFAGRLIEKKGIIFLMEIVYELYTKAEFNFRICGNGKLKNVIENMIQEYQLNDCVTLETNRTHEQMMEEYKNADIFCLPSLRETGGTVLVEAMACRLPIVAFDNSFCSELKEFDCGIFVKTDNNLEEIKKDFCEAIMQLLYSHELRQTLGNNGYKYVNTELTWERKYHVVVKASQEFRWNE